MRRTPSKEKQAELVGFLGLALDNQDEHQRLTRADNFLLVGGSVESHERMQETAIRFNEALQARGKSLQETTLQEAIDLLRKAVDH